MGVKFDGRSQVGMTYHSAEKLRVDACLGGSCDKCMAAVIGCVSWVVQLLHKNRVPPEQLTDLLPGVARYV